jgi:hypothetical protein
MDLAWVFVSDDIWQDMLVHCWCSTFFCDTQQSALRDAVETTKVSLFAWYLL